MRTIDMRDILNKIGQMFILGYKGEKPSASFLDFISEVQIGGVILFEDNCKTHGIAKTAIQSINEIGILEPLFIVVDQEGGRVCRLRGIPAEFKAPSVYGEQNNLEGFKEDYSRATVIMNSLGINLNLSPVADIYLDYANSCLKERCFSSDPEQVAEFVSASVITASNNGLLSCVKHFPGLGATPHDPHTMTAEVGYDHLVWEQRERVPFLAAVEAGVDMVMTTHVKVPALDEQIATSSSLIVNNLLRGELRFDGPVITDDLSMKGATCLGHPGERAIKAFEAGHDIFLFGQQFDEASAAYDYFVDTVRRGEIDSQKIQISLDRIAGLKSKLARPVLR